MPDDQLMQHAPAAVAALRGLYNDDALNAFMDIHGTGDVARVRQALGQLAGAKYDKPVVPGGTMQSQFGDTRTNPGTPPVKIEGNPVSMLEDGKPVSVVRVTTPNGGNAFQHVDGSPVTGTLTGVPDFEYVTRNGRVMSIPKGTRMPTDTQAPAPRVSSMPGSIGAAIDDGRVGDDALKGLPASTQALLKKIANYEADITSIPTRNGERERVAGIVSLYDPSWDQSQYKSRSALRQNFTSGDKSKNIGTLNTAVAHIGELQDAIGKLNNTRSDTYNSIANWASTKLGHADTLNFRTAANAVAAELASLYKGGSATDPEIEKWLSGINSSESPEQLQGFVNSAVNLLRGRMGAIEDSWTAGMGKPRNFSILSPTSRATLTRIGQDAAAVDTFSPTGTPTNPTGMVVVTAPDNTKHEFATQALADEFKRQIGMN
jgi:hypothetical protein